MICRMDAAMSRKTAFISSDAKTFMLFRKDLVAAVLRSGCEVHVLIPSEKCLEPLGKMGVHIHHVHCSNAAISPLRDIVYVCRLVFLLLRIRPDTSFCSCLKPVLYGALASRLMGVGHVCSLMAGIGYVFISPSFRAKIIRFFLMPWYGWALRCSDRVLFQNVENKDFISNLVKNIKSRCFVVDGSGVNMDIYKRKGAISGEKATFVLVGRLLGDKGVGEYVEAANILKKKYGDRFRAMLVGGKCRSPGSLIYADVEKLNVSGAVEILGELDQGELIETYQKSNVFVLPSYYGEGIPRSILEAMSMKMAVITTRWPGCKETVVEGDNGLLVQVRSVEGLWRAMEKLILNPQVIPEWGERSFEMVRERFEVNLVNRQYLGYLRIKEVL